MECKVYWDKVMTFVERFEFVNQLVLSRDEIDRTLRCVKLGLQQTPDQVCQLRSATDFALILLEFVIGMIILLRENLQILCRTVLVLEMPR